MKKAIAFLLTICLFTISLIACQTSDPKHPASEDNGTPVLEYNQASDFEYEINIDGGITITKYIGTVDSVLVPNEIAQKAVTIIGEKAFYNSNVQKVVLPNSTKEIQTLAFASCRRLSMIVLNEGLQIIASAAFAGESKLTELTIPKTVTSIFEDSFGTNLWPQGSAPLLKKLIFEGDAPKEFLSINEIDGLQFTIWYHENANGFSFPRWNGYPSKIIERPNAIVPTFENYEYTEKDGGGIIISAYTGTSAEIIIPSIIAGQPVIEIGPGAFKANKLLQTAAIPNGVQIINQRAFSKCDKLTTVTLPNTLISVRDLAFSYCKNLTDISLPTSLQELGYCAFSACESLKMISIPGNISVWRSHSFSGSGLETVELQNGLRAVAAYAFSRTPIRHIILPNSIQEIGEGAFYSCENLTGISLNEGLITIKKNAFSFSALTSLFFPSTIEKIEEHSFSYCNQLATITLNKGLHTIGNFAFEKADALTEIVLPSTVQNINANTFLFAENLTTVKFEGNAPASYEMDGTHFAPFYIVYYHKEATGFTSPYWCGFRTQIW